MRVRKLVLVAAVLGLAALPAYAVEEEDDAYVQVGVNNGDEGIVSITFGADLVPENGKADAKCEFHQQNRPSTNDVVLVVEGTAHAAFKGTARAVSTGLRCVLKNKYTGLIVVDEEAAMEGSQYVQLPPTVVQTTSTSYIVCSAATVHWSDNSYTRNRKLACQDPS